MVLTAEQKAKIEANRQRALQRLKERGLVPRAKLKKLESRINQNNNKNLSTQITVANNSNNDIISSNTTKDTPNKSIPSNDNNTVVPELSKRDASGKAELKYIRPTVRRKDFIEYDFSTMENSYGGFINNDQLSERDSLLGNQEKTFDDWKREQAEKSRLKFGKDDDETFVVENTDNLQNLGGEIIDLKNLPTCEECHKNHEFDKILFKYFNRKICKKCVLEHPQKYSLLTKTECKQDYLLTGPELNDENLFHRIEKANPHSGTFARMQLFLRCEVEKFSFNKWGGEEGLDQEWQEREVNKMERKEKKFQLNLKKMRKKIRAQEYTSLLQKNKFGEKHIHEFSAPLETNKVNDEGLAMVIRRCNGCGLEVEEIKF
ncbi:related to DNA repair protein RAD14 [Saccharomycodes ludwigii]|uniref:Related to DNA repair protein RAD14 n=1 Tax=Saccharomycodes ludwigii TaxID=36035 RepID=A0A376B2Y9_9ASCO|nr:related to DNA repair protein RAD14 [Saccharomycodes ludwigii]